jgi:multimeric flavodoxin WrbA
VSDANAPETLAPRVLCIAGGPRRHGNSERLLDALIEGVESAGGIAEKLVARDSGVNFCRGCNACEKDGTCIQHDAMLGVMAKLDAANALVVATPIYFATVPAVLKTLLDRCQPYWMRRFRLGEPRPAFKRPGAILVVGGGGDPFGTSCAVNPVKSVFAVLSVAVGRVIEVVGPDRPGDIDQRPEALAQAREAGVELVAAARQQMSQRTDATPK